MVIRGAGQFKRSAKADFRLSGWPRSQCLDHGVRGIGAVHDPARPGIVFMAAWFARRTYCRRRSVFWLRWLGHDSVGHLWIQLVFGEGGSPFMGV